MERTLALETVKKVGEKVRLGGWVNSRRDHGKIVFIDLRDRSGIVQVVCGLEAKELRPEFVIEVKGTVKERSSGTVNPSLATGKIEVKAEELQILAPAVALPLDLGAETLKVELPTLLDYRPLTLRHPKVQAIFKVQEVLVESFRKTMRELGFFEFQAPTIVKSVTEGGAAVFPVKYYNHTAYLGQSPQLYKQIMVGAFECVFTVTKAYRAEPSTTTRHLSEYISLDCEFGFIDSWEDLMETAEAVLRGMLQAVGEECRKELVLHKASIPRLPKNRFPRLKMREAQEVIFKRTGRDNRNEADLTPEDEREICLWAKEKHDSDLIFITHYPTGKRPFYTYPDPEDPAYTLSFDLLGRGLEWITGGQRINTYEKLLENIKKWGNNPRDFELYLQAFKFGMPPEGGFCLGAERVTMKILELKNIREASLFPRDMERIDHRLQ